MKIQQKEVPAKGIKFYVNDGGKEVGRAYLYLITNELHENGLFGFIEDVFVDESTRGKGIGSGLVKEAVKTAKEKGCYKLIITARHSKPKVQELYLRLGFKDWSTSFRMDF